MYNQGHFYSVGKCEYMKTQEWQRCTLKPKISEFYQD